MSKLASRLTRYERLMALRIGAAMVRGESYVRPIGPNRGRVLMLAARVACRIERSARIGAVL